MRDLQVALGHYRTEYNTWPDDPALATSDDVPAKVRGPLMDALLGNNPRSIMFFNPTNAEPGHSPGLVKEAGVSAMHDVWGSSYFLMLDMNGDGQVKNPERLPGAVPNPRAKPLGEFLPMLKAAFSAGPDRDPNTWADNITTWR
ncbi:hypothetical protein [Brevifollis gellanilyticus]|uniref:Uncharacterized protein n=1 Tax=Brevifollis gellanilyticus TaxID=748831 RepID=A0A512MDW5_9BACT|nr:hypothetical protein [Brevifollis gellanilyticus]GEP44929.1 hypothetical protein BGE01nite_42200 [Brevifollis gellanilyticus]